MVILSNRLIVSFWSLPDHSTGKDLYEVIMNHIFSFLSLKDLKNAMLTCKAWGRLISDGDVAWKYKYLKKWKYIPLEMPSDNCGWKEKYICEQKWEDGRPIQKSLKGHTASISSLHIYKNFLFSGSGE